MRKPCLGCVLKHLGAAAVLEEEIRNGYPMYAYLLYGHMDQAAAEAWGSNQMLSKVIRQHRIYFQYKKDYDIPFEALAEYATAVMNLENEGEEETAAALVPPKACLTGLTVDDKGEPHFSGDTRA